MTTTRLARALCIAVLAPLFQPAHAQIIRVKTLPIAESEQFSFMPSAGMAGVSIALADTLLDPFTNPAKGSRAKGSRYFGAPSFFSVSSNTGAGQTLPVGGLWKLGSTFGGIGGAYQQIDDPRPFDFNGGGVAVDCIDFCTLESTPRASSSYSNKYSFALLGHTLESQRISIAASALWSGLDAVDGVDQFYDGNDWLQQRGEAMDVRLGLLKEWDNGRSLEALLVRNRFSNAHDVGFSDLFWDPVLRRPITTPRIEHNAEQTNSWGLHVEYERPLADSGWRIGALTTANRISHPRIPRYDVMTGLGAEGRSTALNFGVGVSRVHQSVAFGLDAIYEPILSNTREDSLFNDFRFSNARLRGGVSRTFKMMDPRSSLSVQIGAELYSIHYAMHQEDRLNQVTSVRKETWLERTRSAGMSFRVPGIEVHYHVRTRSGVGRPGVVSGSSVVTAPAADSFAPGPWMPPVTNAAALGAVRVTWHQFAISIPQR
jgi:hypothetical protein